MANGYRLGLAYVQIVPSMKGVGRSIVDAFKAQEGTESSIGRSMGQKIASGLKSATGDVARSISAMSDPIRKVSQQVRDMPKGEAMKAMASAAREAGSAIKSTGSSVKSSVSDIHSLHTAAREASSAYRQSGREEKSALRGVNTSARLAGAAVKLFGSDSRIAQAATSHLASEQAKYADAANKSRRASQQLSSAQKSLSSAASGFHGKLAVVRDAISSLGSKLRSSSGGWHLFSRNARSAGSAISSAGSHIKASTIAIGSAIGQFAVQAAQQIWDFGKQCVSAYNSVSTGIVQFQTVAKNNGWTVAQRNALDGLATSMQHYGVVSAATTRAGMTTLGAMRLSANQVKMLTPALDDAITGMHGMNASAGDASQTARMLGRAMGGSTNALRRMGIVMDTATANQFKKANADQRAAILSHLLEERYKGVNKALANTPAGRVKQLQNNFNALKVTLGSSFAQAVGSIAPLITSALTKAQAPVQRFAGWFKTAVSGIANTIQTGKIGPAMQKAFSVNANAIGAGFKGIKSFINDCIGAAKNFVKGMDSVGGSSRKVSPLASAFAALGGILKTIGGAVKAVAKPLGQLFGSVLRGAVTDINKVVGAVQTLFRDISRGPAKNTLGSMLESFGKSQAIAGLKKIGSTIQDVISHAISAIKKIMPIIRPIWSFLSPILGILINVLGTVFKWLGKIVDFLLDLVGDIGKVGSNILKAFSGIKDVPKWFNNAGKNIKKFFSNLGKWFKGVAKNIAKPFQDGWKAVQKTWNGASKWFGKLNKGINKSFNDFGKNTKKTFSNAWKNAQNAWKGAKRWGSNTSKNISNGFRDLKSRIGRHFQEANRNSEAKWRGAPGWFRSTASRIQNGFRSVPGRIGGFFRNAGHTSQSIWRNVQGFFRGLPGTIGGFFSSIPGRIGGFFSHASRSVQNTWNNVVGFFRSIPGRIQAFFSGAGQWLWNAGSSIIHGFMSGITSVWNNVKGFFGRIGDWIKAHKGPLDYDRRLLIPAGNAIMTGFSQGLHDSFDSQVAPMVEGVADKVKRSMTMTIPAPDFEEWNAKIPAGVYPGMTIAARLSNVPAYKPSVTQHVNVYTDHDDLYTVAPMLYRSTRNEVLNN